MSRIGKQPVVIPASVDVKISGRTVTVKGPKGTLTFDHSDQVTVKVDGKEVICERSSDAQAPIHGTTRAIINNMVVGVSEGFKKEMQIVGTGYRMSVSGSTLTLNVGYSNPVEMAIPKGIEITDVSKKGDLFTICGFDKQLLGEFASQVRKVRPPEPYKGKGIRYKSEHVKTKQGKKVGA
jgi:large subunit ribosomal protein L6